MIHEGDGWKFTSHITENAFFEDQLVEHMLTGHRAVRRVYSKRLNLDEEAAAAVRRQVQMSAAIEHPGFQRLFFSEEVEEQYCVYGEHMDGQAFDALVRHKTFRKTAAWSEAALLLVDLARDFENLRIGFDHLTLDAMKVRWNLLRTAARYPTGALIPGMVPESRFFRRLLETPAIGGVYLAEFEYPLAAGLHRLKDLLYYMATAQTVVTVEQALQKAAEKEATTGARNISSLGVEAEIAEVLMRLHEPGASKGISSLRDLRRAITLLGAGNGRAAAASSPGVPMPAMLPPPQPPPVVPRVAPVAPPPPPPPPVAVPAAQTFAPTPAPAADSERSSRTSNPTGELQMTGRGREKEDAEEDRSYLYPSSQAIPKAEVTGNSGQLPSSSQSAAKAPTPAAAAARLASSGSVGGASAKRSGGGGFLKVLAVLLAVAVVAAGAVGLMSMLKTGGPNLPPVAAFAPLPAVVEVRQAVELDGSESNDPEGSPLSYIWNVPNMDRTNYRITPNGSREARQARLEVFVPGTIEVTLEVHDGLSRSEVVSQSIEVRARAR
ncbi:MAG: hypothetical protein KF858_02755 [Candidatus Sumerlaeia bacterium]|nr:hypothetical protein [Candidatus Sumerlaeia bacterium]